MHSTSIITSDCIMCHIPCSSRCIVMLKERCSLAPVTATSLRNKGSAFFPANTSALHVGTSELRRLKLLISSFNSYNIITW